MPGVTPLRIKAAWLYAKKDTRLATKLASDPSWIPHVQPSPTESTEIHDKVEARQAEAAALKEKQKISSIYANALTRCIQDKNMVVDSNSDPETEDSKDERTHKESRQNSTGMLLFSVFNTC